VPEVVITDVVVDVPSTPADLLARVRAVWTAALGPSAWPVRFRAVDDPATGTGRVHVDVRLPGGDPAPLVAAGGRVARTPDGPAATGASGSGGTGISWHVVEDPAGVPLCVMGPHPSAPDGPWGPFELVVNAREPEALARWWAGRTGGTVGARPGAPFCWVEGAAGFPFLFWVFTSVHEPPTAPGRVHWDVALDQATVDDLLAAGATVVGRSPTLLLADPEGNEFAVRPRPGGS
jgi:hypothetical protein